MLQQDARPSEAAMGISEDGVDAGEAEIRPVVDKRRESLRTGKGKLACNTRSSRFSAPG